MRAHNQILRRKKAVKVKVLKFKPLQVDRFVLETPEQALYYCLNYCPRLSYGCAKTCEIRRHFKIPPHGPKYPIPETPQKPKRGAEKP